MQNDNLKQEFNPSGVGIKNGKFIGLPFEIDDASLVLVPVPWDATVSYNDGTHDGSQNILDASPQLDLYDPDAVDYWMRGIYFDKEDSQIRKLNKEARKIARKQILSLENGKKQTSKNEKWIDHVNQNCSRMIDKVYERTKHLLDLDKQVALIGGDHSTPLGYYKALQEKHGSFGLLVIDAHLDLRHAYEGFQFSHASIFYNTMESLDISKLIQVGIRDYCEEEMEYVAKNEPKIMPYYDHMLRDRLASGENWATICDEIANLLPDQIAVSVDIDGLLPYLCPHTGTPVAGGLEFQQAIYLIKRMVDKGKKIIGFDLCEVAGRPHEWDGNVGARMCYKLAGQMLRSQKWQEQ